jgi:nicotinamide mononucleotide transporter
MSPLDLITFLLGIANITLIIRRSVWNYPVAIGLVMVFAIQFWQGKLYSDALLQIFFVAANIYGWWAWSLNRAEAGTLIVRDMPAWMTMIWLVFVVVATIAWGRVITLMTDGSHPYWDASILMASIAAQIIMAQRFVQNWHWWIAVNVIQIPLYVVKGMTIPAALYCVFLVFSIFGAFEWRRVAARQVAV